MDVYGIRRNVCQFLNFVHNLWPSKDCSYGSCNRLSTSGVTGWWVPTLCMDDQKNWGRRKTTPANRTTGQCNRTLRQRDNGTIDNETDRGNGTLGQRNNGTKGQRDKEETGNRPPDNGKQAMGHWDNKKREKGNDKSMEQRNGHSNGLSTTDSPPTEMETRPPAEQQNKSTLKPDGRIQSASSTKIMTS